MKAITLRTLFGGGYGLFIGTENQRWFRRWGFPEERLFHTPYVVDNEVLQCAAADLAPRRAELRANFGLPDEAPVIVMVGRLIDKKQPLHLLRAFARVRRDFECSLLVVGAGPLEQRMRQLVDDEHIPDVVFSGFLDQTQVARGYACADVFALISSHDETWGLVVNEAMNFGLPVVVSDQVGSAADLVQSGRNGFVVRHDDLESLTAALSRLVASRDLRTRFGVASRQIISERTYDVTAAGVVAAVEAAVGTSRWTLASVSEDREVAVHEHFN